MQIDDSVTEVKPHSRTEMTMDEDLILLTIPLITRNKAVVENKRNTVNICGI
jgi:hypothetical protein